VAGATRLERRRVRRFRPVPLQQARCWCERGHAGPNHRSAPSVRSTRVTVSVPAGPLLDRAGEIFRTSQRHLVDLYEEVGVLRSAGERFVTFVVASAEGAVVLARAQQDIDPFELVADRLIQQATAMPAVVSTTADHRAPATSTRAKRAPSSRG
jgi:Transcriptional regulator LmrA/YxaF-like, C-terminal domain